MEIAEAPTNNENHFDILILAYTVFYSSSVSMLEAHFLPYGHLLEVNR